VIYELARMGSVISGILLAVIALVLIGNLAGTAISALVNTNTTGWGTANIGLWAIAVVVGIFAFLILILKAAGIQIG
jgi:hypothetical protein